MTAQQFQKRPPRHEKQRTGPQLVFYALRKAFPRDPERDMIRVIMELFSFTPRKSETVEGIFRRFDLLVKRANEGGEIAPQVDDPDVCERSR